MSTLRAPPTGGAFSIHDTGPVHPSHMRPPRYADEDAAATDTDLSVAPSREASDEEEEEDIDESVKEDMKKLEDTFPGISDRFRLVNRIGEGMVA